MPRRPLAASLLFLALLGHVGAQAADDPIGPEHLRLAHRFRFTYDRGPLRRTRLGPTNLTALQAHVDGSWAEPCCRLLVEWVVDYGPDVCMRMEQRLFAKKGEVLESKDVSLAGRTAQRRLVRRPGGGLALFEVQQGSPEKGYFAISAVTGGEHAEAHHRLMEKAVASFTTDLSGPTPEGVHEEPVTGFRIRLEGFRGRIHPLHMLLFELASLRTGEKHLGTFSVFGGPADGTREKSLPGMIARLEKGGRRVAVRKEFDLGGRPAVRLRLDFEADETPRSEHQILVWDGKLFWQAGFVCDRKQGGPPAPLLRALESFRIVGGKGR